MKAIAQVFLSYAGEDEETVENLYRKLSDAGFKPWMDKKDVLPGERWRSSIQKAIQHSDFFLACLSSNSVTKRGFLQKEIKDALDIWQEMLDSDIYLIPVRLEDCEVPETLEDFQWVDLFEENGWTRLVKAIQVGMERRAEVSKRITVLLESDIQEFTPVERESFIFALSRIVNIGPDQIRILRVISGSMLVTLEMPEEAARLLLSKYLAGDPVLQTLRIAKVELRPITASLDISNQEVEASVYQPAERLPGKEKMMNDHKRILILAANPWDTTRLRLDKEVREIRNVIRSSKLRDQISIEHRGAAQPEDLQQELLDVDPHILHFSGHSYQDGLVMEDEGAGSATVNPEALASLLEIWSAEETGADRIECVILNSCYSESIAKVICQYVEYVIGMHQEIADDAAIAFAKGFYRGLGAGKSCTTAFKLGCNAIQLKNLPVYLTPVLMRNCERIEVGEAEPYGASGFDTDSPRLQALWRLAYAFLRLDQLPSGGWSKTLSTWMDTIWEGDRGAIPRNPGMRIVGGTDLTVCAFHIYCSFLMRMFSPARVARLLQNSGSADRVYDNLEKKIGWNGALGTGQWTRDARVPRLRIRHTLMGLIAFLLYGKVNQFTRNIQSDLDSMYQCLFKSIEDWRHDESYLFGMLAAATKLNEMLSEDVAKRQLSEEQRESLQNLLAVYVPQMAQEVNRPLAYNPRPEGTIGSPLRGSMFRPYNDFWRMERSGFLMYFPLLVTDDGKAFLKHVNQGLQMRCAQILSELLDDIAHPYDDKKPTGSLIRYHRSPEVGSSNQYGAPRDWGLSAELAALLKMKVVRDLLVQNELVDAGIYDQKKNALFAALLETFDWYHKNPKIFRFTHGSSFGKILHLFDKEIIKPVEAGRLDKAISNLCTEGITEQGIFALIKDQMIADIEEKVEVDLRALKDMLVVKLESGEYTPDGVICGKDEWKQRIQHVVNHSTIDFYQSELSDRHVERYGSDPRSDFTSRLKFDDWTSDESRVALDVGSGPGQYAELLVKMGFEVKLLDASKKMLELACARLGIPKDSFSPTNIFDASWGYPDSYFDLVFACAIMIHVPKEQAKKIYQTFYQLLKPGGVLFVNFKIGNHVLISEDGRFLEYYGDESLPLKELESVGFRVEDMIKTTNYRDMYDNPKQIVWANFYCKKEEK